MAGYSGARVNYELTAQDLAGIRRNPTGVYPAAPAMNSNAGQQIPMGRQGFVPSTPTPLPAYTPIKLETVEAHVKPDVPWTIAEGGNQVRSNILPALVDRTSKLFGFSRSPDTSTAAPTSAPQESASGFTPVTTRSTPNTTLDSPGASTSMTPQQMLAATPLPKGFGTQRQQDVIRTLPVPETPVMSQAENNALTEGREAFARGVEADRAKASGFKATQDRITLLNDVIRANMGNQFDGPERIAAARSELASITGQQDKALKASEIEAGITKENIQGGFKLREQALRNEGAVAQENVRGGFNVKSRDLDPSQVEENKARALLLTKQAEGTLSKKEQLELNASNKQAEIIQTQKKLGADAYTKTMAETGDPLKAADAQMAVEAALSGDQFIPGTQAQKGTFRFGFGKSATKATPGRVIKKETPPVAGAAKAPDGKWYVSDPKRPGKYLQVGV